MKTIVDFIAENKETHSPVLGDNEHTIYFHNRKQEKTKIQHLDAKINKTISSSHAGLSSAARKRFLAMSKGIKTGIMSSVIGLTDSKKINKAMTQYHDHMKKYHEIEADAAKIEKKSELYTHHSKEMSHHADQLALRRSSQNPYG